MADAAAAARPKAAASRLSWLALLRWQVFRQLERVSNRGLPAPDLPPAPARESIWIFVSTIGELNAISPFLKQLLAQTSGLQLVLITDRSIYRAAYLAQYPQAEVVEVNADGDTAFALARTRPPALFVIAEIPCLPSDAPCRLPIGYLHAARKNGAHITLVNGWLYGYAPNCRIDAIERGWLGRDYLQMFDLLCVQNDEVAQALIASGAKAGQVHVTGNIKFDALDLQPRPLEQTSSPILLASLADGQRPVVVAGCVTDDDERDLVLDAFLILRAAHPDAALVLAPRHPEEADVMRNLGHALQARQLGYRLRSNSGDQVFAETDVVLVLNTMGELRDFYAIAMVTHVGRDHNVLEPLAYGKPVTVRPGWDRTYPSYPVFNLVSRLGLIMVNDSAQQFAANWDDLFGGDAVANRITTLMQQQRGASARCLALLGRYFPYGNGANLSRYLSGTSEQSS